MMAASSALIYASSVFFTLGRTRDETSSAARFFFSMVFGLGFQFPPEIRHSEWHSHYLRN